MSTLALKYRPSTFDDVVGQHHIVSFLKNSLKTNTVFPLYLYTGGWGCGKTSLARLHAKALLCTGRTDENACERCDSCLAWNKGNNTDYLELDAGSSGGIDDIRYILDLSQHSPAISKYRVGVFDEFHQASKASQSALLKEIEEKTGNFIYLLCTTDGDKVLPTIFSRAVRLNLFEIDEFLIQNRLLYITQQENIKIEEDALLLIAKMAKGHLRDALMLLHQVSLLVDKADFITVSVIKEFFNLDVEAEYRIILGNVMSNLILAIDRVSFLNSKIMIKDIYLGLANVCIKEYKKYLEGFTPERDLYTFDKEDFLTLAKFFINQGTKEITRLGLECDLLSINAGAIIKKKIETGDTSQIKNPNSCEAMIRSKKLIPITPVVPTFVTAEELKAEIEKISKK